MPKRLAISTLCLSASLLLPMALPQDKAAPAACTPIESEAALAEAVLHPFWLTARMDRETALFQVEPGARLPTARLLFQPTRILRLTSANGEIVFRAGRDYRWKRGTNLLTLPPRSRIPFRTWSQMHPALDATTLLGEAVGGKTSLLFDRFGIVFQGLQVAITYDHKQPWTGYVPQPSPPALDRIRALLRAKNPAKIVVLGDSISTGSGASSDFRSPPCQPAYVELIVDGLRTTFDAPVTLRNLAVGGKTASWGAGMSSQVGEENPDLVILAFGMNDASGHVTSSVYAQDIQKIIETVRQSSPQADFILVATMSGNPEWSRSDPTLYSQYRDALRGMTGPGIALADMATLSQDILKTKKFDDYTANGVNHPNDFGHRIYAQLILQLLR